MLLQNTLFFCFCCSKIRKIHFWVILVECHYKRLFFCLLAKCCYKNPVFVIVAKCYYTSQHFVFFMSLLQNAVIKTLSPCCSCILLQKALFSVICSTTPSQKACCHVNVAERCYLKHSLVSLSPKYCFKYPSCVTLSVARLY